MKNIVRSHVQHVIYNKNLVHSTTMRHLNIAVRYKYGENTYMMYIWPDNTFVIYMLDEDENKHLYAEYVFDSCSELIEHMV